ncbi:class I SAM-dependent RNA methyltransferase [Clostridium estertheticum]|uniref:THUMP domain-containing class I SAM-dependent RNA methyltransferase n=1 Tax=Clostridium estertheticum TaxID=238834 RepID=UPI001C7D4C47|nr:class I SAM-dependent RNA methyltransferase [Clostridium estertheticum]MBX4259156.1 class I SAM-dependent RNA methyltransferase [Clostridium estertheticum]WLC68842.1 class I SAM-dependent RNA methyltransferase [Clostridium estertheticum]
MTYTLIATTTFGLEAVTAKELKALGYEDLIVENGRVMFEGDEMDIAICNIWLRTAERLFIKMAEFNALSFEELFQGTKAVEWGNLIPEDGKMHIVGKSVKSQLHSVPDCQSIVKKAVVESMKKKYDKEWFTEEGPVYKIEVSVLRDIVTLSIDTSGVGLHKRGYREYAGEAPLKETLAAALVLISKWDSTRVLADPLCGSGTIAIEAALIAKNMAPGVNREFVSETWPSMDKDIWEQVRVGAKRTINPNPVEILASDIDGSLLRTATQNAEKAGVKEFIKFQKIPMQEFASRQKYGVIITNPPYGERLGEAAEVKRLHVDLGVMYSSLNEWSCFVITANRDFQKDFGKKADKNRKLYNGRLLCYYYQYIKEIPRKKKEE